MTPGAVAGGLTLGGMAFLILACGGITGLTVWCFYRILETRERKR